MGENHFAALPVGLYGVVMLMAGLAYYIWIRTLVSHHGPKSKIALAVGKDTKGNFSVIFYASAVGLALINPLISLGLYILVAVMWLIPDRRIEKVLKA